MIGTIKTELLTSAKIAYSKQNGLSIKLDGDCDLVIVDINSLVVDSTAGVSEDAILVASAVYQNFLKGFGFKKVCSTPKTNDSAIITGVSHDGYSVVLGNGSPGTFGIRSFNQIIDHGRHVEVEIWNAIIMACRDELIASGDLVVQTFPPMLNFDRRDDVGRR